MVPRVRDVYLCTPRGGTRLRNRLLEPVPVHLSQKPATRIFAQIAGRARVFVTCRTNDARVNGRARSRYYVWRTYCIKGFDRSRNDHDQRGADRDFTCAEERLKCNI